MGSSFHTVIYISDTTGGGGSVRMQDHELPEVREFQYLGSMLQIDGGVEAERSRRIQSGSNNWKKMAGVMTRVTRGSQLE